MKLENKEPNYSATIIKIHQLLELEGADRLVGLPIHGMQAITSKDHTVGEIGIVFPTECQLSEDFCKANNLYRTPELNGDTTVKGYLEDTRRVKALKLIKGRHISSALFMPLSSLDYLGIDTNELKEGDSFTHINGVEVCRKYIVKHQQGSGKGNKTRGLAKKFIRIDAKLFPEHWDTDSFYKNDFKYDPYDYIICTQKLHGTSARFTNQKVLKQTFWHKVDRRLSGSKVYNWIRPYIPFRLKTEYEFDTLAGSRRVIKDTKTEKVNDHYYSQDLWNEWLMKIQHLIPKNWVLYGEIVGWVNEQKPIQECFTYQIEQGKNELYIYRISVVNEDGVAVDLSWKQVKCFCRENGLKHVPQVWKGRYKDFKLEDFLNKRYFEEGHLYCLPLDPESPCDEGICIRKEDSFHPYVTKAKAPEFRPYETKQLDSGKIDIESAESVEDTEVISSP